MSERNIEIYLDNLTRYTNGNHVGEWLKLPCSKEEMSSVLERIGYNQNCELLIMDYHVPFKSMYREFGEYESLDELNYLATSMQQMDDATWNKYSEVINSDITSAHHADDFINVILNLDKYNVILAKSEEELGRYICEDIFSKSSLPDINGINLSLYVDYEAIGRDISINYAGNFGPNSYVNLMAYEEKLFDKVPDEYKIFPDCSNKQAEVDNEMDFEFER